MISIDDFSTINKRHHKILQYDHKVKSREERNPFVKAINDKQEISKAIIEGSPIPEYIKIVFPFEGAIKGAIGGAKENPQEINQGGLY